MTTEIDQIQLRRRSGGELAVSGALAAESFVKFEEEAFRRDSEPITRVDLGECTFLDSSGVTALLRLNDALRRTAERLELVNPSRPCLRVIEICGLLDIFTIVDR